MNSTAGNLEKGDYDGHPFRGNQYVDGKGGGKEKEVIYNKWYVETGFNNNDHRTLESYIGADYQDINERLRNGGSLGEYEDEVASLDDITSWSTAPADLKVYRGISLGNARELLESLDSKMKNPSTRLVFYDRSFLSTSMSSSIAHEFAVYEGDNSTANPSIFEISVPSGTKCAAINPSELEVLFPRNTKFEVVDVKKKGNFWVIKMEPYTEGK